MTLHAIKCRDVTFGSWVTRCGLRGLRDQRPLPRGSKVGEQFMGFDTALHERDVDCPGCRLPLSAVGAWALGVMADRRAYLREDENYSVNSAVKPPVLYMPKGQIDRLAGTGLIRIEDGGYRVTPLGMSRREI